MTEANAIVEPSAALTSTNWMMIQSVSPAELRLKSCEKVPAIPPEGVTVNADSLTFVPSTRFYMIRQGVFKRQDGHASADRERVGNSSKDGGYVNINKMFRSTDGGGQAHQPELAADQSIVLFLRQGRAAHRVGRSMDNHVQMDHAGRNID